MTGKNDYIALTFNHMNNYQNYEIMRNNLLNEIAQVKQEMSIIPIPSSRYSGGGEGRSEYVVNRGVEMVVEKRSELSSKLELLYQELAALDKFVAKLDRAIGTLDEEEHELIKTIYVEGLGPRQAKEIHHMSERTCFRIRNKAIKKIAVYLYGDEASKRFYFIKSGRITVIPQKSTR